VSILVKSCGMPKDSQVVEMGIQKYPRETYVNMRRSVELSADGSIVKVHTRRGPLAKSAVYQAGQE
jgi:hypothetical protein